MFPIKPEQRKQKSQAPICETGKIQMNTKMNNEKPGRTFKMASRTKSPIRIKQCNDQGSTKPLWRNYSIESMDSDTDSIVASFNVEEILNNYNTCNHLTEGKFISSLTSLAVNLFYAELNCLKYNFFVCSIVFQIELFLRLKLY